MRFQELCVAIALAACPAASSAQTPAERLAALEERHGQAEGSYAEKFRALRPDFEAFAREHAGTEAGLGAKLWLLQQCWWLREEGSMESTARALAEEILETHPDSPQLDRMAEYQYVFSPKDRAKFLQRLGASPHAAVRARALWERSQRAKDEERAELLAVLARDYGVLALVHTTSGALADALANPHPPETLAICRVAPDIVGVDVEGRPMKLSDYRGKVVVLDFWGDW